MPIEEGIDFFKIVATCDIGQNVIIEDMLQEYPSLQLLSSLVDGSRSQFPELSDTSFNLLKGTSFYLKAHEDDLRFVACSLMNQDFKEVNSNEKNIKLEWVVKLFESAAAEKHISKEAPSTKSKPELKVRLLNQWHGANINNFGVIKDILEERYIVKETKDDDYDVVIDSVFGYEPINNQRAYKIFYTGERLPAKLEGYDLSLGFDYLEDKNNYVRFPLYYLYFGEMISSDYQRKGECDPNKPYFACFLVSNSGAEDRNNMFHNLSSYKFVVSGGSYLNNIGRVISENETYQFLSQCKFVIAYENDKVYPGYITEKVFQAYFASSVPLYSSHPSGQSDINDQAIISAQKFNTEKEMISYIIEVDKDDNKYCEIWNQPIITNPEHNYEFIKNKIRVKIKLLLEGLS